MLRPAADQLRVETTGPGDAGDLIAEAVGVPAADLTGGPVAAAAGLEGGPVAAAVTDLTGGPVAAAVTLAEAEAGASAYPGHVDHPFPGCYVCGPAHPDGLRIFPGPVGVGRTAAPFVAPADSCVPTVWAALDCPGGWAVLAPGRPYLLGRITATVAALPTPGQRHIVVGELVSASGRKAEVRTALYDPHGRLLAAARATWIAIAAAPEVGEPV